MLLNHGNTAQDAYDKRIPALQRDLVVTKELDSAYLLSYNNAYKKLASLTGVLPITTDICPNTCLAFTSPSAELNKYPE